MAQATHSPDPSNLGPGAGESDLDNGGYVPPADPDSEDESKNDESTESEDTKPNRPDSAETIKTTQVSQPSPKEQNSGDDQDTEE